MKSIILIIFIFFAYVGGEIIYNSDDFSKNQERTIYDVNRFVRDTTKCIASAKMLEGKKEFFINNNVHNDIKLLNFFNLIPALINSISNVTNSTCSADLSYIKDNVDFKNYQDSWAIKMLDSFGKPESGILEGNLKWLGNFDECRSVYAPKENDRGGFHGQYCTMQVTVAEYLPISIAVCLPDTCKPSEFVDIFNNSSFIPALNKTGIGFNVTALTCKAKSLELSTGGIVTLCIMSVFFLLVFLGSSVTAFKYFAHSNTPKDECKSSEGKVSEYFVDRSLEEPLVVNEGSPTKLKVFIDMCDPVLNCFCVFTNGSKLFNTDSTEGQLLCLHGIRFLSMTWVIVCHVYMSPIAQIRSMKSLLPLIDNLPFQAILNGWYSVDSFFVLSGFLMSYLYFQECAKKQGKTPWLYFYVHRYLRLTPVYMIVLAFYATVMPIMGSGPFWQDNNVDPNCQKGWWWNLIYINNFQNQSEECMGWSWYLANDMQFFAISPLFLITLWRWPKVGYSMLLLFLWGSWLSGFLITYHYDLIAGTLSYVADIDQAATFTLRWTDYMNKIYVKPYTRIAPYLIGIGLGYILFKRKVTDAKVNRVTLWIGWLLAIPVGLYCVYGLYHQTPNLVAASFYNALTRTGYGLSLSWLIFVCLSGQGGVVDKILSYKLFIPLSRLTYCAYLIHLIVVYLYISSLKTTIVFTHQTIVLMFLGLLIVTYALSVLVSLAFESPIIRLEKLIRSKFQNR